MYNRMQLLLVGFFVFSMLVSCKKEPPRLPKETQEGLGTFGCLVNGELVVQRGDRRNRSAPEGNYDSIKNQFVLITGTEYVGNSIRIFVAQPKEGTCVIDSAIFYPTNPSTPYYYVAQNTGQMNFTRFDSGYASGTFEFDADAYEKQTLQSIPNRKIQVRKGVFDVKLYEYSIR